MTARRRWQYLAVAAPILAGAALHFQVVHTRLVRLAEVEGRIDELERTLSQDDLMSSIADLRSECVRREGRVPSTSDLSPLLASLAEDLDELAVRDRALSTVKPIEHGEALRVPLQLAFRGTFAGVFELLQRLEQSDRLVRVRRLIVNREPGSTAEDLAVSARFETYLVNALEEATIDGP